MDTLTRLETTITQRLTASPDASYVAKLHSKGLAKIAQKVGEEATETVIAALTG
ncbi:MAG: phosphoribosyl-ATP diphosphatase, partial [Sphingomonadales bacterium]|nr:phosphoribosyl-ATP diphosphatase [Sphingomonadales bacterium]